MRKIRYRPWTNWFDAYHGWRDGLAALPARLPSPLVTGPATTPHREALIRQAQDAFAHEHLAYRATVAKSHQAIMAERARLAVARDRLTWARAAADMESRPLPHAEATRRRWGEEHHPESVVVTRRHREQRRLVARARQAGAVAATEVAEIEAALERATEEARQQHRAAVIRVERIHEHIHRRLAVYRRTLIRWHPEGAWVNAILSPLSPEVPGWALPDAYLPDAIAIPASAVPEPEAGPEPEPEPEAETITLRREENRFGSQQREDTDRVAYYEIRDSPVAAPWHFTIMRGTGQLLLTARGYEHGPYIDGEPVASPARLGPGDYFDFSERRYTVQEDVSQLSVAKLGKSDLIAVDLHAMSKSKVRLSDMSFVQRERTLLAVLGPSGAGKSSTFEALLGELPLQSGQLYFRGLPMATHARQIREQLGFVPQQTELHPSLTVEATLRYGFGLRSPAGRARRADAVDRVIEVLRLERQRGQLLSTLSGGQLRRVSIALELLTQPSLLMLDEPTSGLDASMDREIMTFLREYAEQVDPAHPDRSHTVIVVTHATEHLNLAHQILVVVQDGAPAYSGPPRQIRKHFKFGTFEDLMSMLFENPREWADRYRASRARQEAFEEASRLHAQTAGGSGGHAGGRLAGSRHRSPRARFQKFGVLVRRQCELLLTRALKENERSPTAAARNWLVVSLPFTVAAASAGLAALVAASPGLGPGRTATTALTLLSTLSILSGQALTYSDVVNEMPIIRREYRVGVGAFPVLATKWLVYAALAIGQAGVITGVFCLVPHRAPQRSLVIAPVPDLFLGLAALSVTAMTLGLLVSVLAAKLEHAVALVTAISITQIALNGLTSNLSRLSAISALSAIFPDRWGVAAVASSVDLRGISPGLVTNDPLWTHSTIHWATDVGVLAVQGVAYFALATWMLRSKLRLKGSRRTGASRRGS